MPIFFFLGGGWAIGIEHALDDFGRAIISRDNLALSNSAWISLGSDQRFGRSGH